MERPELLDALTPFVQALEKLRIPYYIGGSVASSVHGVARSTLDIDIVADMGTQHAAPLAELLRGDYYADDEMMRSAILRGSTFNVIHLKTMIKIDVFTGKKDAYAAAAATRVVRDTIDDSETGRSFNIVSPEDVILAKLDWYRKGDCVSERQWNDVLGVLKVQAGRLDLDYMRLWAGRLDLAELLARAIKEAGE